MAAGYYAHFRMTKGYEETGTEEMERLAKEAAAKKKGRESQKISTFGAVKCNPHLIFLFLSNISKYIVLFMVNGLAIYYFTYVSKNPELLTGFLFAANILSIVASYCAKFIVAKINAKRTEVLFYLIMAAAGFLGFFMYSQTMVVMGLLAVPVKVGIIMRGILISACLALANFNADIDPSAATEELERGISMGFMILPAAVILVGALLLAFGYRLKQED